MGVCLGISWAALGAGEQTFQRLLCLLDGAGPMQRPDMGEVGLGLAAFEGSAFDLRPLISVHPIPWFYTELTQPSRSPPSLLAKWSSLQH